MYTQIVKSFLLIIFCGLANTSLGQYTAPLHVKSSSYDRNIITQEVPARIQIDSVSWRDLSPQREKKFWRAGAEWFLAQAVPASFNRFITKDPYSYISFQNFIDHQRLS